MHYAINLHLSLIVPAVRDDGPAYTASGTAMRGVPLPVVQQVLGHSDIAVTQRYAHLAPAAVRNEMERAYREIGDGTGRVEEPGPRYALAA